MTRHLADENTAKLPLSIEDEDALILNNVKLLNTENLDLCNPSVKSLNSTDVKPTLTLPESEVKECLSKCKQENPIKELFNIERDSTPEKQLNINLGVDLYQMENY